MGLSFYHGIPYQCNLDHTEALPPSLKIVIFRSIPPTSPKRRNSGLQGLANMDSLPVSVMENDALTPYPFQTSKLQAEKRK